MSDPREWWIYNDNGEEWVSSLDLAIPGSIHVVEYSALEEAQAEIKELRLQLSTELIAQEHRLGTEIDRAKAAHEATKLDRHSLDEANTMLNYKLAIAEAEIEHLEMTVASKQEFLDEARAEIAGLKELNSIQKVYLVAAEKACAEREGRE